jgi:hypothetical protein
MLKLLLGVAAFVLCQIASPDSALAWGPCVHLHTGNFVLNNLGLIDPVIAELLDGCRNIFLYGCLSADIFIGKGSTFTPSHCHNWTTGFRMLGAGRDRSLTAFAYGYLTHLAADTLAHNFYVPNLLGLSGGSSKLRHVYIEMLADRKLDGYAEQAQELLRAPHRKANAFLRTVLEKGRLDFSVKREIYRRSLDICGRKTWQGSMSLLDRAVPMPEADGYLQEMLDLSANVCVDFLKNPMASVAVGYDPIGSRNLRLVKGLKGTGGELLFPTDACLAKVASF